MGTSQLKYSLLVFLGGASYGGMAATVKLAYAAGFTWDQAIASQALFGFLLFALILFLQTIRGKKLEHLTPRRTLCLFALGVNSCITGSLYNYSLSLLPVSVAIVLLFQFTWIGIVIQVITTRRKPGAFELLAALIIAGGTLSAAGIFSSSLQGLNPLGILCGLLSALSCALFMFFSGRIEKNLAPIQRGFFVCMGALMAGLVVCPSIFSSGVFEMGIWKYGVTLGLCALFIPVILFGIATPHLSTGLATIMASSELPFGIIISVLLTGENVDGYQVVGIITIMTGVIISQIPSCKTKRRSSPKPN